MKIKRKRLPEAEGTLASLGPVPHTVQGVMTFPKQDCECPHRGKSEQEIPCLYCQKDKRMKENFSAKLTKRLLNESGLFEDAYCTFQFKQRGQGAMSPSSTTHVKHALNMSKCMEGVDFSWQGPYILHLSPRLLTRDMLTVLQASGAEQVN